MGKRKADPKVVGERLRKLRGIRTRTGVARELGIPYSLLSFYETGERSPRYNNQQKLADYYGVSRESIFCTDE